MIRVSILLRGQAAPPVSRVLGHSSAQASTPHLLLPVLAEVKGMLDFLGLHEVRLLADRGFRDTALMAWIRVCGFLARATPMTTLGRWHYHIRIKSNLILDASDGQRLCKVNDAQLAPRKSSCFHNIMLTGQHFGPVHVALCRPANSTEQWRVVSNKPTSLETSTGYGERFQIEQGFLDEKSGLFGLERLILVLTVATLLLVSKGIEVVQCVDRRHADPH